MTGAQSLQIVYTELSSAQRAQLTSTTGGTVSKNKHVKVVAPVVAPRATDETGYNHLKRKQIAWRGVPGYMSFVQELANGIATACVAFVRAGNELHGVSNAQGFKYVSAEVEQADGTWRVQRTRLAINGTPTRNYRHVVAAIDYALKTEAQRKRAHTSASAIASRAIASVEANASAS